MFSPDGQILNETYLCVFCSLSSQIQIPWSDRVNPTGQGRNVIRTVRGTPEVEQGSSEYRLAFVACENRGYLS